MPNLTILSRDIRLLDNLCSLNDLHKASGGAPKHQPALFMQNQQTKSLIYEIEGDLGIPRTVLTQRGGANRGTWVCKELVYSYAMWISPKFHLKVIRAFESISTNQTLPSPIPHTYNEEPFSEGVAKSWNADGSTRSWDLEVPFTFINRLCSRIGIAGYFFRCHAHLCHCRHDFVRL